MDARLWSEWFGPSEKSSTEEKSRKPTENSLEQGWARMSWVRYRENTWGIKANIYGRVFSLIKFSAADVIDEWDANFALSGSNIWILVFATNLNQFEIRSFQVCSDAPLRDT